MGASFVGYMLVGPQRFTEQALYQAKQYLLRYQTMFREWDAKCEEREEWELPPDYPKKLAEKVDWFCLDYGDIHGYWVDTDFDKLLKELEELWEGSFNTICRDVGDKRVVVSGDCTWGDEPEFWEYETIRLADILGLLDELGVE